MTSLVSIVVPVYNVSDFVCKCVMSLVNQTYQNIEVILVDDGSTDGSSKICDDLSMQYSKVKVFHQSNKGLGAARNKGIELAEGSYILFVDSDDWIKPTMIQDMLEALVSNNADIAICGIAFETSRNIREYKISNNDTLNKEELIRSYLSGKDIRTIMCNKLYKKNLFKTVHFPVNFIYEDYFIMHDLLNLCNKAVLLNNAYYVQHIRNGSITQSMFSNRNYDLIVATENLYKFIEKNYNDLMPMVAYKKIDNLLYLIEVCISSKKNLNTLNHLINLCKLTKREYKEKYQIYGKTAYLTSKSEKYANHIVLFCFILFMKSFRKKIIACIEVGGSYGRKKNFG